MNSPLVSFIILSYNSRKYLPALFESLAKQSYQSIEYIVVDNASSDGTVEWINHQSIIPITKCIANTTNDWFAKGNNHGAQAAQGEYIVFCNDDMMLDPECVSRLIKTMQADTTIGLIGAKLLKLTTAEVEKGELMVIADRTIDSAGILLHRSYRANNRGENEIDRGQYDVSQEIFGITGALMLVSRNAFKAIQYNDEFFDEDFIAYKEDVDVSWRMHRAGFTVFYQPEALAFHARTVQNVTLVNRKNTAKIVRAYSYRNHLWTIYKNSSLQEFLRYSLWIVPYETCKCMYILIAEWASLKQLPTFIKGLARMKRKRVPAVKNYSLQLWIT